MKVIDRKISELIPAEYNPRILKDKQYKDIKKSLQRFGIVDPIIVNMHPDRKNVIVGGHQRVKVWADLGNETIPCTEVSLDLKKEQELNVRLNKNTGEFDFDALANFFEVGDLKEWGFEDWEFGINEENGIDYAEKNKEIDVDDLSDKMKMSFEFNNEEYIFVRDSLMKISGNAESALLKLLGYGEI
jgi:hypothetical protein